jgi:hypothetical protein
MLGSTTPVPVSLLGTNNTLWLGITVGADSEMTPREQIASVPFAMVAHTVPDGSITNAKLAPNVLSERVHTLTLPNTVSTTSNAVANFGNINLSVESNLHVMGNLFLQNNTAAFGMRAALQMDGNNYSARGDGVPMSAAGIGHTFFRYEYIPNVPAGQHSFSVRIDQFPFRSGESIHIITPSVLWIRAVPVQ